MTNGIVRGKDRADRFESSPSIAHQMGANVDITIGPELTIFFAGTPPL
jgi:hypothetical protein